MSPLDELAELLHGQAQRLRNVFPESRWFYFGSFAKGKQAIGDVDLLVVCSSIDELDQIRRELEEICLQYPIHLMLMTHMEEAELNFIASEGAVELGPIQPRPRH